MRVIRIGRGAGNDVVVNDPSASRTHCQIVQEDNGNIRLIDVNSSNGTFINGQRVHGEVILHHNDVVRVGSTTVPWQNYVSAPRGRSFNDGLTQMPAPAPAPMSAPANNADVNYGHSSSNSNNIYIYQQESGGGHPTPPGSKPGNFLVWAILATLFCCLPFGIVSIVYASKVDGLWAAGDYSGAIEAASKARLWFWWSFGIALVCWLIYIIFYAAIFAAFLSGF